MRTHTKIAVYSTALSLSFAFGAEQLRFGQHVDTNIRIHVSGKQQVANVWIGQVEIAYGVPIDVIATGVYLPGSRLFYWSLIPSKVGAATLGTPSDVAQRVASLQCAADSDSITCFAAGPGGLGAKTVRERVDDESAISTMIAARIAKLNENELQHALWDTIQIDLSRIDGIAPLYASDGGKVFMNYTITKLKADPVGWELTIRRDADGRVGVVRIDRNMHAVSAAMINNR